MLRVTATDVPQVWSGEDVVVWIVHRLVIARRSGMAACGLSAAESVCTDGTPDETHDLPPGESIPRWPGPVKQRR